MKKENIDNFMAQVHKLEELSTCDRGHPAAIIVKDNKIIGQGFAHTLSGIPNCVELKTDENPDGHSIKTVIHENGTKAQHCMNTIHAEAAAIANAAKMGNATMGATCYCTMYPCFNCASLLIAAGISYVVSDYTYRGSDDRAKKLFIANKVRVKILHKKNKEYTK